MAKKVSSWRVSRAHGIMWSIAKSDCRLHTIFDGGATSGLRYVLDFLISSGITNPGAGASQASTTGEV